MRDYGDLLSCWQGPVDNPVPISAHQMYVSKDTETMGRLDNGGTLPEPPHFDSSSMTCIP
jgi:hypothetical protein